MKNVNFYATPSRPSLEGLSDAALARIAEFNARPMRRADDVRILGWDMIEAQS